MSHIRARIAAALCMVLDLPMASQRDSQYEKRAYSVTPPIPQELPANLLIVLTDQESLDQVPQTANLHPILAAGGAAARRWHVKAPHVRGFLFGRLCDQVVRHGPAVLAWLRRNPRDTEQLFYKRARWRPQLALW